jgi:ParB/RepB/Spo0J family partition protein
MNAIAQKDERTSLVIEISIGAIEPHPDNPRTFPENDGDDAGLVELAASIKAVGLLEPVLVRPLPDAEDGWYQLVAGERRWRACRLAGLEVVPAIVRVLDDHQALEVLVTENLQRESLQPLEEARGIRALIDREGWTVADVADRLGRSLHWVAQRARLTDLSERWRKAVEDPKRAVSRWPASFLVEVARLDSAAQDELDAENHLTEDTGEEDAVDLNWLQSEIAHMLRKVSGAPWKIDDEALYPEAGSCRACLKRSSCHPGLFEDEDIEKPKKTDRCLDVVCWEEKAKRHLAAREATLRAEHKDLVFLMGGYERNSPRSDRKDILGDYQVDPAKKSDPGAVPALVVTGRGAGTVRWVKPRRGLGNSLATRLKGANGKPVPKTMAERRSALDRRRKVKAVELLKLRIQAIEPYPEFPECVAPHKVSTCLLLAMAAVFGTKHQRNSSQWDGSHQYEARPSRLEGPQAAWKVLEALRADGEKCLAILWDDARLVLLERLAYQGTPTDVKRLWADAEQVSLVLGLDAAAVLAEATVAIPEPKSWARLGANGKPKTIMAGKKAKPAKAKKPPKPTAGVCRACGCTDNDCEQCIEKAGEPCHWIEPDLCSACKEVKPPAEPKKARKPRADKGKPPITLAETEDTQSAKSEDEATDSPSPAPVKADDPVPAVEGAGGATSEPLSAEECCPTCDRYLLLCRCDKTAAP